MYSPDHQVIITNREGYFGDLAEHGGRDGE